jgi:hypothetical protein
LENLRTRLYSGELLRFNQQQRFCDYLVRQVRLVFGDDYRRPCQDFMGLLGAARQLLRGQETQQETLRFLETLGFSTDDYAIDYLRLRGVIPGAESIPAAAPAFYAHRDTWYANPQSQINLWMPLHDVTPENSFAFYEDYFEQAVLNDSADFDYDNFRREVGFQNPNPNKEAIYPRLLSMLASSRDVTLGAGEVLLFAAAHLHQTLPNRTTLTRFSVDLRIVHRADFRAGIGAPNLDNRSSGDAMIDYPW